MVVSYCIEYFEPEFKSPERTDFVTWKIPRQFKAKSAFRPDQRSDRQRAAHTAVCTAFSPFHIHQGDCKSIAASSCTHISVVATLLFQYHGLLVVCAESLAKIVY
jgi:hypothetical protein